MLNANDLARRRLITATLAAGALCAAPNVLAQARPSGRPAGRAEALAAELFESLVREQRAELCFPYDSRLRAQIDNFWFVVPDKIADALSPDQQRLAYEVFMALHSEEYGPTVLKQVEHDGTVKFASSTAVAFFGTPASDRFQMVLTAHHCTRRTGGDAGVAFGGPIFYGHFHEGFHEKADHPGNVYWYQAKRANGLYQMLDGRQRERALVDGRRRERGTATVNLKGTANGLPGIALSDLARDQQDEMRKVLADLVLPFRREDAASALSMIERANFEGVHLAFYKADDIGNDGVWDNWQLEGPNMLWFFRGAPHVHVWVHVRG